MAADDRPQTEERYDEGYEERDSTPWFPYPGYGWLPWSRGREPDETYDGRTYDQEVHEGEDGSWWDEGLITLLFLVGIGLFIFPEPATSGLGIALIATAAVLWLADWAR